jgi:tripartite-type tricarboxylate transporter receptor subunit TctC
MNALVAGRVDYMCDQVVSVVPQVAAGSVKAYAVATVGRNPALPAIPTSAEAGLPKFQASAWNALFAPKNTSQIVISTLNNALGKALDNPDVRNQLLRLGCDLPDLADRTPLALANLVKSEIEKWSVAVTAMEPEK